MSCCAEAEVVDWAKVRADWGLWISSHYSGINSSWRGNYVLSRVISKHLHLFSTEVFRQSSEQEITYTVFLTSGHVRHPAPFPMSASSSLPLSGYRGQSNHSFLQSELKPSTPVGVSVFLLFEHGLSSRRQRRVLFILVFAFNLWECLMEAQHSNAECTAKWWQKAQRCVP